MTISIGRAHVALERAEHVGEARRMRCHRSGEHLEDRDCRLGVAVVAGEGRDPQERVGGERVGRGRRVVEHVLGPHNERFGVVAGCEEPAVLGVEEEPEQVVGNAARLLQPVEVVELGQREQGFQQRGVVLGVRQVRRAPRPSEAAVVTA